MWWGFWALSLKLVFKKEQEIEPLLWMFYNNWINLLRDNQVDLNRLMAGQLASWVLSWLNKSIWSRRMDLYKKNKLKKELKPNKQTKPKQKNKTNHNSIKKRHVLTETTCWPYASIIHMMSLIWRRNVGKTLQSLWIVQEAGEISINLKSLSRKWHRCTNAASGHRIQHWGKTWIVPSPSCASSNTWSKEKPKYYNNSCPNRYRNKFLNTSIYTVGKSLLPPQGHWCDLHKYSPKKADILFFQTNKHGWACKGYRDVQILNLL